MHVIQVIKTLQKPIEKAKGKMMGYNQKLWVFRSIKKQRFNVRASMLENKSNKASSHYENSQVSVTYSIDL